MKIIFSAAIFALFLITAKIAIAIAPHSNNPAVSPPIFFHEGCDTIVIRGTIKPFFEGTALVTDTAIYPLIGGDFTMIVDNEVQIIGEMVLEDDLRKIEVVRVQFERTSM